MIDYAVNHLDKLSVALLEHLRMLVATMIISVVFASILTMAAMSSKVFAKVLIQLFSVIYSIPSLAFFSILIPVTGLGEVTAITALVAYNQYVLLRNFIAGLNEIDPSILEAAVGIGMSNMQILFQVRLPLSIKTLFTGIRLAVVSTIGIATIAAFINAGGLGSILFDGLRTLNVYKILWGSLLSAGLTIGANVLLIRIEKRF